MKKTNYLGVVRLLFEDKKRLFASLILFLLAQAFEQSLPYLLKIFSDLTIEKAKENIFLISGGLLSIAVIVYILKILCDWFYVIFADRLGFSLLKDVTNIAIKNRKHNYEKINPDKISRIAVSDIEQLKRKLISIFFTIFYTGFSALAVLFFLFMLDWVLTVFVLVWVSLFYFLTKSAGNKIASTKKYERDHYGNMMSFLKDAIYSGSDIKYFFSEKHFYGELEKRYKNYEKSDVKSLLTWSFYTYLPEASFYLLILILVLYKIFIPRANSVGTMMAIFMYAQKVTPILQEITGVKAESQHITALYEPVKEIFEMNNADENRSEKLSKINSIRFENAVLGYEDKSIFSNLCLEFKKGKVYIIEGRSGFGKSTLIYAMIGENPIKGGNIFYNNINLNNISLDAIAKSTALISQNIYLMNTTIKNNISLFDEDIPDQKIKDICMRLGLPNPETEIGTSEIDKVSGGERKKIAFARLFLQKEKKDLIIFDEVYANLDKNSIKIITALLKEIIEDKIIIIVNHDAFVKQTIKNKNISVEVIDVENLV